MTELSWAALRWVETIEFFSFCLLAEEKRTSIVVTQAPLANIISFFCPSIPGTIRLSAHYFWLAGWYQCECCFERKMSSRAHNFQISITTRLDSTMDEWIDCLETNFERNSLHKKCRNHGNKSYETGYKQHCATFCSNPKNISGKNSIPDTQPPVQVSYSLIEHLSISSNLAQSI